MNKYRQKAIEIEAIQWDGNPATGEEIAKWTEGRAECHAVDGELIIRIAPSSDKYLPDEAEVGDWIVKDEDGFCAIGGEYFAQVYEPISQAEAA